MIIPSPALRVLCALSLATLSAGCGSLSAPHAAPAAATSATTATRALPALAGTRWSPIAGASIGDGRAPHLQLLADGRAIGSGGCNRFTGAWQSEGNALRIGPLGATRMACPEAEMHSESAFFKALEATRGARSEAGRLVLLDASGALLLTLEPVP